MYFDKPGNENTQRTLELALKVAKERGIKYVVVASNSGASAEFFKNVKDIKVVCVTHAYGFKSPGENEISNEKRQELINVGISVLSTTHVLSGAERSLSRSFNGISPIEVMANTLRMFGQGTKVAVEVAVMAVDSGLIPYMEPVVAIGGTHYGADTAIIIKTAHASNILDTKIQEFICKPAFK